MATQPFVRFAQLAVEVTILAKFVNFRKAGNMDGLYFRTDQPFGLVRG
jgi:hypothetical protein